MRTCSLCKFGEIPPDHHWGKNSGMIECHNDKMTNLDRDEDEAKNAPKDGMFVFCEDGCCGVLFGKDFGCIHWEQR